MFLPLLILLLFSSPPTCPLTTPSSIPKRYSTSCILGLPNAGKSTLLNQLVGADFLAVSSKPQTTRKTIFGLIESPTLVSRIYDAPGVVDGYFGVDGQTARKGTSKNEDKLWDLCMSRVEKLLTYVDCAIVVLDAWNLKNADDENDDWEEDVAVVKRWLASSAGEGRKLIVVLNKVDAFEKTQSGVAGAIKITRSLFPEALAVLPVCADKTNNVGVECLRAMLLDEWGEGGGVERRFELLGENMINGDIVEAGCVAPNFFSLKDFDHIIRSYIVIIIKRHTTFLARLNI